MPPMLTMVVMVLHAPHGDHGIEEQTVWWADTTRLCHEFKAQLILADANGRVGNVLSDAVGPHGHRQNEDAGGELFHAMLLEANLMAINTLSVSATDKSYTWLANRGNEHRIDYI
eukprot:4407575-Pyramimonas_sp.AAC.1